MKKLKMTAKVHKVSSKNLKANQNKVTKKLEMAVPKLNLKLKKILKQMQAKMVVKNLKNLSLKAAKKEATINLLMTIFKH